MIDVLIVDDDKLVRKGLMSAMPWDSFGMRVIGEAANGEKALEFLKDNRVDLLMTDVAMPVMSGIELIRIVRKRYPDVAIAVLTLHQDFEYIQEALRLGAVDYIAKVQLEKERFEEVLGRIHELILNQRRRPSNEPDTVDKDVYPFDTAYAILALGDQPLVNGRRQHTDFSQGWRVEADGHILLWTPDLREELRTEVDSDHEGLPPLPDEALDADWRLVRLRHIIGLTQFDLLQMLRNYRQRDFFYDCDGYEPNPIAKSVQELQADQPEPSEQEMEKVKEALHAFRWVHDDSCFDTLCSQLRELRLPTPKLMQLLYGFIVDWSRLFKALTKTGITLPDTFSCWSEVVVWMGGFREMAVTLSGHLQLSREVSVSIMSAVKIVHDEFEFPLFAVDVAKRVNLSRSYFNQCFKAIVGYSFNEYLRKVRIDKAREYLAQTAKPIVWVAEHTGYADEKYFSRTFREQTGMLPSEYRQQHKSR
ncbi:response regulator transcription factor [Paenibacillus jiagnxiensis]|uniref:response regulator transcription factor n=1 Tax=Paenibacillus jiagnxiensis TaxID=3228926 RepID=UPI0033A516DC